MKIEYLKIAIADDELESALKCISMPQNVRIRGARFEPEELIVDVSLFAPFPMYPSFHVSVIQAAGPTLSLKISSPLITGPLDFFVSRFTSNLPNGVTYLGNGVVSLDIPALANGTITSINMEAVQFENGRATIDVSDIDLDIIAISQLSAANRGESV